MNRILLYPLVALAAGVVCVVVAFALDSGDPTSRDAALLLGTAGLWAAAASTLWTLAAGVLVHQRRRSAGTGSGRRAR